MRSEFRCEAQVPRETRPCRFSAIVFFVRHDILLYLLEERIDRRSDHGSWSDPQPLLSGVMSSKAIRGSMAPNYTWSPLTIQATSSFCVTNWVPVRFENLPLCLAIGV